MPTHPLLPFVESPDGLGQDFLNSSSASMPGAGSSMTPHSTVAEKSDPQAECSLPLDCMFCDQTFTHQDDLGPHILTQHPTTLFEPAVLCVDAEFRVPDERTRSKPSVLSEQEEVFSCIVCGQAAEDASELETHLRKHKDHFTHCCNICGRRYKESWFLKSHMRVHGNKAGARTKAQQDLETPVTINDVIQDQIPEPVVTSYKICVACGFFFPDKESLVEHSKVHNKEPEVHEDRHKDRPTAAESPLNQEAFLQAFQLRPPSKEVNNMQPERFSRWIAQLDPFNTYQAWQLATKGKVAIGPNPAKEVGPDASSDNEDSCSDKEELNNIWSGGQGDNKPAKEVLGRELRSKQQTGGGENPSPEPDQRSLMRKDKPTHCEDCGRTFKTYRQLVLHSRVHKKERGEDSPTASIDGKLSRADSLDGAEEGSEDGSEEGTTADTFYSDKGEDGFYRMKVKNLASSRQCSYCGKTFRSSYCLNIHLRTHTGEKPYKCVYCDYAGAQKTSLRYHLDRHHKDKPYTEIPNKPPSKPVLSAPSPNDKECSRNRDDKRAPNRSKLWPTPKVGPATKLRAKVKSEDGLDRIGGGQLARPLAQVNVEQHGKLIAMAAYSSADDAAHIKCPVPVNLKMERKEIKDEEGFEAPLNLSLKVSLSISGTSEPQNALIPIACSSCAYKTLYPEVLLMHKRLIHKDKSDMTKKNGLRGGLKQKRYTGCPPALEGKDVTPLPPIDRSHPRRTKSPIPQPAKPAEKIAQSSQPLNVPKRSPMNEPRRETGQRETGQEAQRYRMIMEPRSSTHGQSRFTEIVEESSTGGRKDGGVSVERPSPVDRMGIGQRGYTVRNGVIWPSDSARLCLSSRFGNLPAMDFNGEPSNKRLKYSAPSGRETDTAEVLGFRIGDGYPNRLLTSGRNVKTLSQGSSPPKTPQSYAPMKASPPAPGSSMVDTDWNMINILRSYSPSDLASLYHPTVSNPSHGGLSNPRPGIRPSLYQQLPTLPNLQRRDHSSTVTNERCGPTD